MQSIPFSQIEHEVDVSSAYFPSSQIIGFSGSMQSNPAAHGPHVKAVNCSRPDSHLTGCSAGFRVVASASTVLAVSVVAVSVVAVSARTVVASTISGTKVKVIGKSIENSFSGRQTKYFRKVF